MAKFRAYPDIGSTFDDYVNVVGSQPRYDGVRDHGDDVGAFARGLQDAGYATDPDYAEKINAILDVATMKRALSELKQGDARPIISNRGSGDVI